jgi:phenylpropionate dioxygenase-like ring-hydroxylating dioxygenase large terminal subunit
MTSVIEKATYFTSLPQSYYLSADLYAIDIDKVWRKQWLLAGHVSRIPRPGDYFTYEIANESLIIIRGKDDRVNALYNTCRHRGFRICEAGTEGRVRRLVCPYHAWTYGTDGELKVATQHTDGEAFDYSDFGLHVAQVDVWQGFIFVSLSDAPLPPIGTELAAADESFSAMQSERMKIAKTIEYPCAANWKLLMENILECYHCAPSHPELCKVLSLQAMHAHHTDWSPDQSYMHSWMPLKEGVDSLTMDGRPVCSMPLGVYAEGQSIPPGFATGFVFQPSGTFGEFYQDHGITATVVPVSPTESKLTVDWFVHADAEEGTHYDVEKLIALWDVTTKQDIALADRQHLGVLSSKYAPGPNSATHEPGIHSSLTKYLAMIGNSAQAIGL